MKICMRRGYHPVYDEILNYPPSGIEFVLPKFTRSNRGRKFDSVKRKAYLKYVRFFNLPNMVYINPIGADVIHSCGGIIPMNKKEPWVMDVEQVASFVGFMAGRLEKTRKKVEKMLSRPACKKLMPWTKAGYESIINGLDASAFEDKMEVVYPAMHLPEHKAKKEKCDRQRLLFVSVRFFTKGGKELLEAYEVLSKKYDIELTIVSDVPVELQRKHPSVRFYKPNISREKILEDFFPRSDIFVLPSFMDTFGIVLLEAMAFGMPIVASNVFAIPEMIEGCGEYVNVDSISWYGKDKLFAWSSWEEFCKAAKNRDKPEIVADLVKVFGCMLEDSKKQREYGLNGKRKVEKGVFSINHRNKQLKQIYEEASRW